MPYRVVIILMFLIFAAVSYLLGSISFSVIFTRLFTNTDVRDHGSGNAGMTNVMRTAGLKPGVLTLLFDFGKATLAVVLGKYILTSLLISLVPNTDPAQVAYYTSAIDPYYGAAVCGFFCLLGHIYPVFFNFRGGKGVLTCIGMILIIDWRIFLVLIGIFFLMLVITRIVSLSSVVAALFYPVLTYLFFNWFPVQSAVDAIGSTYRPFGLPLVWFETIAASMFTLVLVIKHMENIRRLLRGDEKPFKLKSKKD